MLSRIAICSLLFLMFWEMACSASREIFFDKSWQGDFQIPKTEEEWARLEKEYLNLLRSKRLDFGFYGVGTYENDFRNGEDRYWYGVEWRLFDEGYYQARREKAKKILETRLQFLQLQRDHFFRRLLLRKQHIYFVENLLLLRRAEEKRRLLKKILVRREKALAEGFATRLEVERLRLRLDSLSDEIQVLERFHREKLGSEEIAFLNSLEKRRLRPLEVLYLEALKNSLDLRIQEVFVSRAEFYPSWKDDLDLRFYLLAREEFSGRDRWLIGVKLEVPLYFDRERSRIVSAQKTIYESEKRLIREKIKRELALRTARFERAISQLKRAIKEYSFLKLSLQTAEEKSRYPIQNLETEPKREVERIRVELLEARYEVLSARLKAYLAALEVLAVYGDEDLERLFR